MFDRLILTCEHGGNEIPEEYRQYFEGADEILQSHRGWDPGALELAQFLSKELNAPLFYSTTSRLLIELNRSLDMPDLFSEFTQRLFVKDKEAIIERYYQPYREAAERAVSDCIDQGYKTLHLSVHSCTPVLNGVVRYLDMGILFDPDRPMEQEMAEKWKENLLEKAPHLDVRYNEPYLGIEDGFTTYMRKHYPAEFYAGIEVEINQKYPLFEPREKWDKLMETVAESLKALLR